MNREFRTVLKNKSSFPTEDAALKLVYLRARKLERKLAGRRVTGWDEAAHEIELLYEKRFKQNKNSQTQESWHYRDRGGFEQKNNPRWKSRVAG